MTHIFQADYCSVVDFICGNTPMRTWVVTIDTERGGRSLKMVTMAYSNLSNGDTI